MRRRSDPPRSRSRRGTRWLVPWRTTAAERSSTLPASSTQTSTRALPASCASRSIFSGSTTSLETSTSPMPPATIASASETFWQHTPTAPPSSIWMRAMSADLWVLAWARWRTPILPAKSRMRLTLRSKASRSMISAGVWTSSRRMPIVAGTVSPTISGKFLVMAFMVIALFRIGSNFNRLPSRAACSDRHCRR